MRFKNRVFIFLGYFIIILLSGPAVYAASETDKTLSPYFFIENGDPSLDSFPLKSTNVITNINGIIAEVIVCQKYKNDGSRPITAQYIFPASTRAAVHGMEMKIGDEIIKAQIRERKSAEHEFKKAKKSGKSASLLKQQRSNIFSMNVANIMPGDAIDIILKYTELLIPIDGTYEFTFPTVVGPRYSNQNEQTAPKKDLWIKNPYLMQGKIPPTGFNITCNISTGIPLREVSCRSHETRISWESKSVAQILLKNSKDFCADRDYIINYSLAGKKLIPD